MMTPRSLISFQLDRGNSERPQWFVTFGVLALAMVGCGDSAKRPHTERVSVEGLVTLDGQPLEAGAIVFYGPLNASGESVITSHALISKGRYQIDEANGPAIGTSRVEVRPKPLPREEYEAALDAAARSPRGRTPSPTVIEIPEHYSGPQSALRAELVGGKMNRHDFQLDSRS